MPIARVRGRSMIPTLHPGDFLWIHATRALHRGQVVLVQHDNKNLIKRDYRNAGASSWRCAKFRIFIDGKALVEPGMSRRRPFFSRNQAINRAGIYPKTPTSFSEMLADDSLDSRQFGAIGFEHITGAVSFRLWPPPFAL